MIEDLTKRHTPICYSNNGWGASGGARVLVYNEPITDLNGRDIYPPNLDRHFCTLWTDIEYAWGSEGGCQDKNGRWRTNSEQLAWRAVLKQRCDLAKDELTATMEDWWYYRPLKLPLLHQPIQKIFWRDVGEWLVGGGTGRVSPPALVWQAFFQEKEKRQGILGFVPRVPDVSSERISYAFTAGVRPYK
jgi:hypothetical protein